MNQVQYAYNDAGLVTREYQEHQGAVDGNTLYTQYDYAGAAQGYRPTAVEYPNGRKVHYTYGTSGSADDNLNRLSAICDDDGNGDPGQVLAAYSYLGLGTIVTEDFQEPQLKLDYTGGGDSYTGLDRFNRVVDQLWRDYGSSTNAEQYTYGYDLAGDVAWKENVAAGSHNLDELYGYNDQSQLTSVTRGQLDTAHDAVLTGTADFAQVWTLDGLGNWDYLQSDTNGDGTLDTARQSGFNGANEIRNATGCVSPVYDRAGNMTAGPQPGAESTKIHLVYDAWNWLVAVKADNSGAPGNTIAQYEYDGLGRLIVRAADTDQNGTLDTFTHYFYAGEQLVETRDAASLIPNPQSLIPHYQYVYSIRYVDSPILRDENTDSDNLCDDGRVYYLTDANNNVTALADSSGNVIERYVYAPYGGVTIYDSTWSTVRSSSSYANSVFFGGRELDPLTGFYNNRARWYHPGLGTFTSRDPLGLSAGPNLYGYTGDNPISRTDPSGLFGVQPNGTGGVTLDWRGCHVFIPAGAVFKETWNVFCYDLDEPDWEVAWGDSLAISQFIPATGQTVESFIIATGIIRGRSTYGAATGPGLFSDPFGWLADKIKRGTAVQVPDSVLKNNLLYRTNQQLSGMGLGPAYGRCNGVGSSLAQILGAEFQLCVVIVSMGNPCSAGGALVKGANAILAAQNGRAAISDLRHGRYWSAAAHTAGVIGNIIQLGRVCFAAGTPLLTPDGSKPIEQFKPGDLILSAPEDDPDGLVTARRVEEVFQRIGRVIDLRVGGQTIRTTHEHPFYVHGKGWKQACALSAGDLLKSHDGRCVPVDSVTDTDEDVTVYNMRIEEYHTYFAGSTDWGFSVWAHNTEYAAAGAVIPQQLTDLYRRAEQIRDALKGLQPGSDEWWTWFEWLQDTLDKINKYPR